MIVKLFIDFFSEINFDCAIPLTSKVSKTFVVFNHNLGGGLEMFVPNY